jgi:hypothetical protein
MTGERPNDLDQMNKNIRELRRSLHGSSPQLLPGKTVGEEESVAEKAKTPTEEKKGLSGASLALLSLSPALTVALVCGLIIKNARLKGPSAALGYMCSAGVSYAALKLTGSFLDSYRAYQAEPPLPDSLKNQPRHISLR